MRLFIRVSCLILGLTLFHVSGASAQSVAEPHTITVTPFVGGAFGTSDGLGGSLALGAAVGYDFTSKLGAEGEFAYLFDVEGNDANVDSPVQNYSANVVYHVNVKHATPYATFGLGVEHIGRSVKNPDVLALYLPPATEIAYNFGGGVKYPLTPNFLVRGDFRRFQANDLAPNYRRIYSGLTWWIKREAHTCQSAMGALTWRACAEMHRSPDAVVPPSDTLIPIGSLARISTRRHLARIGTCRHPRTDRHL